VFEPAHPRFSTSLCNEARRLLAPVAERNPTLVSEIGKLPELQERSSSGRFEALKRIVLLYAESPTGFDIVFEQMFQTGKPEVRRYCSPLQALFWLVADGQIKIARQILSQYSLDRLLCSTWPTRNRYHISWPGRKIEKTGNHCDFQEDDAPVYVIQHSLEPADYYLLKKSDGGAASGDGIDLGDAGFIETTALRWGNFQIVADRLNAPELIDFFQRHNLGYDDYLGSQRSVRDVFESGRANCVDTTRFALHCLHRAGYKAEMLTVPPRGRTAPGAHLVTKFYDRGRIYIMDNGRANPQGISGPLDTAEDLRILFNQLK
jgi:hypothetical protein